MIYLLSDDYGNNIAISNKTVADKVLESGANPFNNYITTEEIIDDEIIVDTYEQFIKVFY